MAWLGTDLGLIVVCSLIIASSCEDDPFRGYIQGTDLENKAVDDVKAGSGSSCKLKSGKWCWISPTSEVHKVFDFLKQSTIIEEHHKPRSLSKYYYRVLLGKPGYWQLQVVYQSVEDDIFYTRMTFPFKKPAGGPGYWFDEWKFGVLDPEIDRPFPKPILRRSKPQKNRH